MQVSFAAFLLLFSTRLIASPIPNQDIQARNPVASSVDGPAALHKALKGEPEKAKKRQWWAPSWNIPTQNNDVGIQPYNDAQIASPFDQPEVLHDVFEGEAEKKKSR